MFLVEAFNLNNLVVEFYLQTINCQVDKIGIKSVSQNKILFVQQFPGQFSAGLLLRLVLCRW